MICEKNITILQGCEMRIILIPLVNHVYALKSLKHTSISGLPISDLLYILKYLFLVHAKI